MNGRSFAYDTFLEFNGNIFQNLLELFMFVLHEYGTGDDINNTDRIPTTGCHLGGRFAGIFGIRLKNHLPDLENVENSPLRIIRI